MHSSNCTSSDEIGIELPMNTCKIVHQVWTVEVTLKCSSSRFDYFRLLHTNEAMNTILMNKHHTFGVAKFGNACLFIFEVVGQNNNPIWDFNLKFQDYPQGDFYFYS